MSYTLSEDQRQTLRAHGLGHIADAQDGVIEPGTLKQITRHDPTGRPIHEFKGDKSLWMNQFKSTPQLQLFISNGSLDRKASLRLRAEMIANLGLKGAK